MAISIDWPTKVITIPQADLTFVSGNLYELDVNAFRLSLRDLEDDFTGMVFPTTHTHNTSITLSGVTYARFFEIINGYTVTFENGSYRVSLVGANNNIPDVANLNSVSILNNNSAGLILVQTGSGLTTAQDAALTLAKEHARSANLQTQQS